MDTPDIREIEARKMELNRQVERLLSSGLPVAQIAEIIGAEDYLRVEERRGKPMATVFDTKRFVNDEVQKLTPLQLPGTILATKQIILPPGEGEIITGSGEGMETKEFIPRTRYLVEILTELKLPYSVISGKNKPGSMRGLSYEVFLLPSIQKIVFINNEAENATFIIHQVEDMKEWQELSAMSKEELKKMDDGKRVSTIVWSNNVKEWKDSVSHALSIELEIPKKEFARRNLAEQLDEKAALISLEEAFVAWQSLPESERGKFNSTWLESNGFRNLNRWAQANVSLEDLVAASSNPELKKNFEQHGYTSETALAKLEEAFGVWQSLPESERGSFNTWWIANSGHGGGIYNWSRTNISLDDLVNRSGNPDLKKHFKKRAREVLVYTEETALAKLEEAFRVWQSLPEAERGEFNVRWLSDNYQGLYNWSKKNTSLTALVALSSFQELKDTFVKRDTYERYTEETALARLEQAFLKWQSLPEDKRTEFNSKWLVKNGFAGLFGWARENTALVELVNKSSNQALKDNFVKREKAQNFTEETALAKLEEAFVSWQSTPKKGGSFNAHWLVNNGYASLYNWCKRNTQFVDLVAKSENQDLKSNFTKGERIAQYTVELAVERLETAFAVWQALPETTRGIFNSNWLDENGYSGIRNWTKKNDVTLLDLVDKSFNEDLKKSFSVQDQALNYTSYSALLKLEEAFATWQTLPQEERGNFTPTWLKQNGYNGILKWSRIKKNASLSALVASSSNQDLKDSFAQREIEKTYTDVSALDKLEEAFLMWQVLSEDKRPIFNGRWLRNNGYSGLVEWCRRNDRSLLELAGRSSKQQLVANFRFGKK